VLIAAGLIGVSLSSPSAGAGQSPAPAVGPESGQWEIRFPGGLLVPTGDQRRALGDAHVTAVQVSRVLSPRFAFTGSFAISSSEYGTPSVRSARILAPMSAALAASRASQG
jgi:hypothetical protein